MRPTSVYFIQIRADVYEATQRAAGDMFLAGYVVDANERAWEAAHAAYVAVREMLP